MDVAQQGMLQPSAVSAPAENTRPAREAALVTEEANQARGGVLGLASELVRPNLIDRAIVDWRMGDCGGVFGWQSRPLLPGLKCAHQNHSQDYYLHQRSVSAAHTSYQTTSLRISEPAARLGGGGEAQNKLLLGCEFQMKREMHGVVKHDDDDDDDEGFDLSWFAPAENSRALDTDCDLLEPFELELQLIQFITLKTRFLLYI